MHNFQTSFLSRTIFFFFWCCICKIVMLALGFCGTFVMLFCLFLSNDILPKAKKLSKLQVNDSRKPHQRCLARFWIRLCICAFPYKLATTFSIYIIIFCLQNVATKYSMAWENFTSFIKCFKGKKITGKKSQKLRNVFYDL